VSRLVCGITPGEGGVGRLIKHLAPAAREAGFKVMCRPERSRLGLFGRAVSLALFYIKLGAVSDEDVVVIYPQSIRWQSVLALMNRNRVVLYLMDNSFFCIRSYNTREGVAGECLDCLGDLFKCHPSCRPYPDYCSRSENLRHLEELKNRASKVEFWCQNQGQADLARRHFGPDTSVRVVGMSTGEFSAKPDSSPGEPGFDVVFHGDTHPAKGGRVMLRLAAMMPGWSFLFPAYESEVRRLAGSGGIPENVNVREMRWETGLKEEVERAGLVLCPSLWSAPIEGALAKSIIHNGKVGVWDTAFGYQAELPPELLLRLGPDAGQWPQAVEEYVRKPVNSAAVSRFQEDILGGENPSFLFGLFAGKGQLEGNN
jgi:hypothetical protein